ncbi:hypothetical protein [Ideonella sp. YS5]|uniref:hypothetical protein n=1 Tax=Ideonella sp. YS5 TaxID=3453714 RepID=UPI003EEE6A0B
MSESRISLGRQPTYVDNQLLMATDFIEAQEFMLHARHRQNLGLHGWGVARGLEVSRLGDGVLGVSSGFAIDEQGREIELEHDHRIEVLGLDQGSQLVLTLAIDKVLHAQQGPSPHAHFDRFAVLRLRPAGAEGQQHEVVLAQVHLDHQGHIRAEGGVSMQGRRSLHLRPGSVTARALAPELRRGWITVAFHPSRLNPQDKNNPPPFHAGPTRAWAYEHYPDKDHPNERGAGGSMAFQLPPGIRELHRFKVAGEHNRGTITASFFKGGVVEVEPEGRDKKEKAWKHSKEKLCEIVVDRAGSYSKVMYPLSGKHVLFNASGDGDDTLGVEIRATSFASVSLVGVEVSY